MTEIRIHRNGTTWRLRTALPWEQALDILQRAWWPDGPMLGAPVLPKVERRARR